MIHLFFVVSSLLRKHISKIRAYFTMISELCVPNKQRKIKHIGARDISLILSITIIRLFFSECIVLQDCRGQLTPKVFDILHVLRGQFTAVIEINIFKQKLFLFAPLWAFLLL